MKGEKHRQLLLPLSRLSCSAFCSQGIQTLLNKVTVRQSIVSTLNLHHCPGSVRPSGHWDPQTTLIRIPGLCTTHAPTQTPSHSPSTDWIFKNQLKCHIFVKTSIKFSRKKNSSSTYVFAFPLQPLPYSAVVYLLCVCHPTPDPKVCLLLMSAPSAF